MRSRAHPRASTTASQSSSVARRISRRWFEDEAEDQVVLAAEFADLQVGHRDATGRTDGRVGVEARIPWDPLAPDRFDGEIFREVVGPMSPADHEDAAAALRKAGAGEPPVEVAHGQPVLANRGPTPPLPASG